MTTVTESMLDPALEQFIRKNTPVPQYNRPSVTLDLLQKRPGIGKNLAWDISVGTATGQVFAEGQAITTYQADTPLLALLPWAEYGDTFQITGRAEDAAAYSQTMLASQMLYQLGEARTRSAQGANNDLYTGTGNGSPNHFTGYATANGPFDASGTYANQDRGTYTQWQGNVLGNGGVPRALTLPLIEYGLELVYNASGKTPTYGATTANLWRRLCELVGDKQRVNVDVVWRGGEVLTMKLGYNAVEVNGIPIFKDISVPSGNLLFFHEPSNGIEYLPVAPSRIARGKVKATVPLAGTPQEQTVMGMPPSGGPLVAILIELPSAGNFDSWQLVSTCNSFCERPNANLWIKDLSYRTE